MRYQDPFLFSGGSNHSLAEVLVLGEFLKVEMHSLRAYIGPTGCDMQSSIPTESPGVFIPLQRE